MSGIRWLDLAIAAPVLIVAVVALVRYVARSARRGADGGTD